MKNVFRANWPTLYKRPLETLWNVASLKNLSKGIKCCQLFFQRPLGTSSEVKFISQKCCILNRPMSPQKPFTCSILKEIWEFLAVKAVEDLNPVDFFILFLVKGPLITLLEVIMVRFHLCEWVKDGVHLWMR